MKELNPQKLKAAIEYINSWLSFNFDNSRLPGLSVAIQHNDKLVYSKAFGFADVSKKEKMTTKHTFRIASHSKTFTATAIMQLTEQGKLNLDDKVSKYLSWFKSQKDKRVVRVTIRQLLNHTAGLLRDGENADHWQYVNNFPDVKGLKESISKMILTYDSDEEFKYSNLGFGYLGLVIEAVSGMSYKQYVSMNIIDKLKLRFTGPELDDKARKSLATGYGIELFNNKRKVFKPLDTKDLAAATGFYASAEDLCSYFATHFIDNEILISDASKRQMQHGYWKSSETFERYGLGLVNYKKAGWKLFGHSGGIPGFITNTQFDRERKLAVTVLANAYDSFSRDIVSGLIDIIDTFQQDTPTKSRAVNIQKFAGRFFSTWGPKDMVVVGSKLFSVLPMYWQGFSQAEQLSIIDDKTLKIDKADGYGSAGGNIDYRFDKKGKSF